MEIIKASKLTKYYGKSRGIVDLDLSVGEGDVFGFIGPNGAGKSTTIRILLGLISASSGSAYVFGKDVSKERKEILADIGYMPSEAMFYSGMQVQDIINFSAKLRKKNCSEEMKRLCDMFGLDRKKKVEELSLGNRKKVEIICAFQHRPRLYILDEPTSGLDPLMQKAFFELVEERHKEGATIFLSSHALSEIQRYCLSAAIIRDGRLIKCDKVAKLSDTSARKVSLQGITYTPKLAGIKNVSQLKGAVSFLYQGDIKALLTEVNKLPISDMTITEPELEEIFLHYYEETGFDKSTVMTDGNDEKGGE